MKISAIDIRKHTFEKIFRGYNPDEVDAFLNSLSQEWERFSSENSMLKMQLDYAEKELSKLKDIESTLFRTLKSAEDVSKQIEKEAIESADKRVEESKERADSLIAEAEQRTNQIILETENRLKKFKEDFAVEIKNQERDFRAIENFRDNLVVQLSSLANNTIETVERFENKYDKESVLNKMEEIKQHVAEIEIPKKLTFPSEVEKSEPEVQEAAVILKDETPEVAFEIVSTPEAEEPFLVEEEIVEEEPVTVLKQVEVEAVVEEIEEISVPTVKEEDLSAADAATEALAELRKSRETRENERETRPRENTQREAVNTFREKPQEPVLPKSTGGSFFDQI
ncbi:DivIVA domain-containing protein [Dyadobacter subterraneus]|uniref:DivIVA domain-containing protein n=1 Tax=Dyadobacter subterraneus TaxID=2773304 RepID=A0ABR9W4T3_9BACT|nr:DivIVA domain-containing protein [Dyadobacter subterraneus]MBE9460450.1 DivIVA domain-containing protein [Dyadobacter subterraneus]